MRAPRVSRTNRSPTGAALAVCLIGTLRRRWPASASGQSHLRKSREAHSWSANLRHKTGKRRNLRQHESRGGHSGFSRSCPRSGATSTGLRRSACVMLASQQPSIGSTRASSSSHEAWVKTSRTSCAGPPGRPRPEGNTQASKASMRVPHWTRASVTAASLLPASSLTCVPGPQPSAVAPAASHAVRSTVHGKRDLRHRTWERARAADRGHGAGRFVRCWSLPDSVGSR